MTHTVENVSVDLAFLIRFFFQEVAGTLARYQDLLDVSVYGVQIPKHDGRAGCAAIVIRPGATLDLYQFACFAKQSLPKYAVPLFLRTMQAIPKTENNKHAKSPLKAQGVDPSKVSPPDCLYWLKKGIALGQDYVRFAEEDWKDLEAGRVSL